MYQTRSQVEGLLNACFVHTYSSCSLWTGIVDKRDCEFIHHCSGNRYLDFHNYCVLNVDQTFVIANILVNISCINGYLICQRTWIPTAPIQGGYEFLWLTK